MADYVEYRTSACRSGSAGDCDWKDCPQAKVYRESCPLLDGPADLRGTEER